MKCSISNGCVSLKQAWDHYSYWIKANAHVILRNTSKVVNQGLKYNFSFYWKSGLQKGLLQACPAPVGWSLLRHLPLMKRSSAFYKLFLKIQNCSWVLDHSITHFYHIPSTSLSSSLNFILSYVFKLLWPFIILLKVSTLQLLIIFFGSEDSLPCFPCTCRISVLQRQEAGLQSLLTFFNHSSWWSGLVHHPTGTEKLTAWKI